MKWLTHFLIAFVVYLLFVRIGLLKLDVVVVGLAVGSVIPDIDHPKSLLGGVVKHRGIVHSPLALGVSVVLLSSILSIYNANPLIVFGFFLGYLIHLVTDSLTPMGVKWLQPFKGGSVRFIIRTGGFVESIMAFLFAILLFILLLQHYGIQIPYVPISEKLRGFALSTAP